MASYGINYHLVETAYGDRPFEMTESSNPRHYQFRTSSEIWQKESMINLAIQRLPHSWKQVAWIDTDIAFTRPDIFQEAWHQLQHHSVIQLFSDCVDLGPNHEIIQSHKGFCFMYHENRRVTRRYEFAHPGFAWAATREAMENLGGLIEAPLGAADHHMALALVGKAKFSLPGGIHPNYSKMVMNWQDRAEQYIKRNIGFVPGLIYHHWHGSKKNRKYVERWDILTKNNFDPEIHLTRSWTGLLELSDKAPIVIRDDIRAYFRQRQEDGIDID